MTQYVGSQENRIQPVDVESWHDLSLVAVELRRVAYKTLNGKRHFDVDAAAEDIVQDVLLDYERRKPATLSYLKKRTRLRCLDHLKAMKLRAPFEVSLDALMEDHPSLQFSGEEEDEQQDPRYMLIVEQIAKFTPVVVDFFYRYYFRRQRIATIARQTGRTPEVVTQTLFLARQEIKKNIAQTC